MTRTERIHSLCKQLGVKLKRAKDSNETRTEYGTKTVYVQTDRLEETPFYYATLHELGHVATFEDHKTMEFDELGLNHFVIWPKLPFEDGCDSRVLDSEGAATEWAMKNAGEEPDADAWKTGLLALNSYVNTFDMTYGAPNAATWLAGLSLPPLPDGITWEGLCTKSDFFTKFYAECKRKASASKLTPKDIFTGIEDDSIFATPH